MKIAVCFLYILFSITYLTSITDLQLVSDPVYNQFIWGGINIITQLGFIAFACSWLEEKHKGDEQLLFQYIKWVSVANSIYIIICIFRNKYWVIYNTGVFAYIMGIAFLVFLIHLALRRT